MDNLPTIDTNADSDNLHWVDRHLDHIYVRSTILIKLYKIFYAHAKHVDVLSSDENQYRVVWKIATEFMEYINAIVSIPSEYKAYCYRWALIGSFAHQALVLLFQPAIFNKRVLKHSVTSRRNRKDAIMLLSTLVSKGYLDTSARDYYSQTPFEYLLHMEKHHKENIDVLESIRELKIVFYHGKNLQQYYRDVMIRMSILVSCLKLARQRDAVRIIEDRWLEVVLNPYTKLGQRMLGQRSERWYALIRPDRL